MKKLVRHFITGEYVETDIVGPGQWVSQDGELIPLAARDEAFAQLADAPKVIGLREYRSKAMGCPAREVAEKNRELAKFKVDAKYLPNGDLVMGSRKARNQMLRLTGSFDRDASFGDYAGQ